MIRNRLVLVAGVLAAGCVAAWPFRHPRPPPVSVAPPGAPSDLPLRRQDVTLQASPPWDSSPAVGLEQLSLKSRRVAGLPPAAQSEVAPALQRLGAPPPLEDQYQSLLRPGDAAALLGSPYAVSRYESSPDDDVAAGGAVQPLDFRLALREHRIVDGDTLDRLALRYLGDAQRSEEIFELNRDRLRDPSILPVGKRLRIPHRGEGTLTPVPRTPIAGR